MSRQRYPEESRSKRSSKGPERQAWRRYCPASGHVRAQPLAWIKLHSKPQEHRQQDDDQLAELRKPSAWASFIPVTFHDVKRRIQ